MNRPMGWLVAGMLALLAAPIAASAQPKDTVSSLLKRGFNVIAAVQTAGAAPGLVLQKEQQVFMCFVSETPSSLTLSTRYCKPVE